MKLRGEAILTNVWTSPWAQHAYPFHEYSWNWRFLVLKQPQTYCFGIPSLLCFSKPCFTSRCSAAAAGALGADGSQAAERCAWGRAATPSAAAAWVNGRPLLSSPFAAEFELWSTRICPEVFPSTENENSFILATATRRDWEVGQATGGKTVLARVDWQTYFFLKKWTFWNRNIVLWYCPISANTA